jgi:hypothetical protein
MVSRLDVCIKFINIRYLKRFEGFLTKFYFNHFSYYDIPVDEVRKLINAIDDHRTQFNSPPFTPYISKRLRTLVGISELTKPVDENKLIEVQQKIENNLKQANDESKNKLTLDNLKQMNDEFKQQIRDELKQEMRNELKQTKDELMKEMQVLLNSFVKNSSNANNDVKT